MFLYLQTCLNMMAAILKFMFVYNQIMILDDKSFKRCVCDFAATLTRSNINLEFVYLCISSKDFAPISAISYYNVYTLSCSSGVVLCVFHYIDEIRNVRSLITFLF